jgi:rhodanese-related sulfurtransferase
VNIYDYGLPLNGFYRTLINQRNSLMKKQSLFASVLFALLAVVAAPDGSAQFGGLFGGAKVESIETADLAKMLQDQQRAETEAQDSGEEPPKPSFVVVDVRSDAEVNVSVIPGAITKSQFEKDRQQYEGRMVIPYCTVGGRSGAYAKKLKSSGVRVKNYEGSILKWIDAELPLVTLDGKPTNRVHTYSDRYKIPAKYEQVTE